MSRIIHHIRKNNKNSFTLQLTSMVDMFTILLVFMLKSQSTSAIHITPSKGLNLPYSSSEKNPVEALKLVISRDGIYLNDQMVVELTDGNISPSALDPADPLFIKPLFEALDLETKKSMEIAERNSELKFEGTVLVQADSKLNFGQLSKVMHTASLAGYADLKLATLSSD